MINQKIFEHRPINELVAIVRNDFRKFDHEGLIDEGTLIKTVMYCNDKLGISIREIRETAIDVIDFKAELPMDFEKVYYICALNCSNTIINMRNPFDNNFDQTKIDEACLNREQLGCVDNYQVVVRRGNTPMHFHYNTWTQLSIAGSDAYCHHESPNKRRPGKYEIYIKDGFIHTPFKSGTLYLIYVGMMKDSEGNITFPFHPLITPYYEWMIKEKILNDAIFNSDGTNLGELFKLAQAERVKSWLDAHAAVQDKAFGDQVKYQRKKELGWYHQWFRYFQ